MLRPTLDGRHEQARRLVPEPHRGTGLVPLLTARAACSIGIHLALSEQRRIGQGPRVLAEDLGDALHTAKDLDPAVTEKIKKSLLGTKAEDAAAQKANIKGFVEARDLGPLTTVLKELKVPPFDK